MSIYGHSNNLHTDHVELCTRSFVYTVIFFGYN